MDTRMRIAGLGAAVVLAGCSSAPTGTPVTITAGPGSAFATKTINVTKGAKVTLTLENADPSSLHDLTADQIPVKDVKASGGASHEHGKEQSAPALHVAAASGKSAVLNFTPTEAGEYTFYCSVTGHKESGMTGTIVVN